MSNSENQKPVPEYAMDVALIIVLALGIATWVCYFLSISRLEF